METIIRLSFLIVLFSSLLAAACGESVAPVDVSYQEHIQDGIFNLSCLVACHDSARQAGLELTSWETLMEGGDNGPVVEIGNAEASPLVWSVEGRNDLGISVSLMPPAGFPQLNGTEIRLIKDWIDQGAKNN
ncbi:MAG: hypothetical protein IIA58_03775 [Candidatus Marinimicrobia bacterium]|nr:hypothetical protein [Candidatus Neomarinimicrobiota bacterium]